MKKVLAIVLITLFIILALFISSASFLSVDDGTNEESIFIINTVL